MLSNIVIGILAGHGPKTTAPFLDRIVSYCQILYGARLDSDLPHMMIYSLPVPFFPNKPVDNENLKECLRFGVERLKNAQIHFLVIPSNYIHTYYDFISQLTDIPILHIVEEALNSLPTENKKLALLGASSTIELGTYQKEFLDRGIDFFHDDELQDNVSQLIISIKQTGFSAHSQKLWKTIYNYCLEQNCDSIMNTNSDLSPCLKIEGSNRFVNITDSYDALAHACVKRYLNLTQRNNLKID
ncbi:aspartate/glutamate racemase family protein [Fluviispira multicolorata]|uniref:Amino-acid racemase n=1 Tax=Fluviispira multicolorata TaxID=2654512 RepID=A0A833N6E8_9BACT|nr:aspartate/glutamate racemase family protein [Fluviispira multicolorata]KAB8033355.1 amino-acid racemase [Fluviispira multicolorata]